MIACAKCSYWERDAQGNYKVQVFHKNINHVKLCQLGQRQVPSFLKSLGEFKAR